MTMPSSATTKPLRADARRNRERILAAARTVFAERGVDAQMDDVARAAGVGVGTVYRHFPHKEALLGELVAEKFRVFGDNAEVALQVEDPWEAFTGLLRANAELCARDAGVQAALAREPAAWRLAEPELERLDGLANQVVARAQAAGALRMDFKVTEIPMLMGGLYSSMAVPGYDWRRHLENHPGRPAGVGVAERRSCPVQTWEDRRSALGAGRGRARVQNSGSLAPAMARVQNTSERVFVDLLEAVVAGRYAPGEKLPRQRELASDLGVTLQPLREALKRLEQMGLVEARHGDATRVRDWRAHGTLDVLAHLGPAVLGDILEARSLMLREMAGLAAQRRDGPRARAIGVLARRYAQATDVRVAAELDFAFFTEVAEAAGNLVFLLILNAIRDVYFEHLDELPVAADVAALAPGYAAVAAAIEAGDAEAARAAAFALAEVQRAAVSG